MHFLHGSLPWKKLATSTNLKRTKYQKVLECKQAQHEALFVGYPAEFRQYFDYCTALAFDEQPDYRLAFSYHIIISYHCSSSFLTLR